MRAMSTTSLKLDDDIKGRVQRLAAQTRRSAHWLMREAIEQYVEREEKQGALRASAIAAWEAYRATRLHVTGEEADVWLARLEAGEDAPPPNCHV